MAAVTAVGDLAGQSYASFLTPSLDAALTVDAVAGQLQGLDTVWQALFVGIRQFGRLVAIGQYQLFTEAGSNTPYAAAVMPAGPGFPQGYTVASLAAALLATASQWGNGPLYTYTARGWAAVTKVRTTINGLTGAPYSVELEANPIPAGLALQEV